MKNLRLDMITYSFREKIEMHPQQYIESLGITYKDCEGVPIADVFMFYDCENIPNELPYFITLIEKQYMPTNHDIMQACIDQITENNFEVGYIDPQFVDKFKPTINELSEVVKNELGKLNQ